MSSSILTLDKINNILTINGNITGKLIKADNNKIAIGQDAGSNNQEQYGVAIGNLAGSNYQRDNSVAIGSSAGCNSQSANSVALGRNAGRIVQSSDTVAIGYEAGCNSQGQYGIAIGKDAGRITQGYTGVALGVNAGSNNQANNSVAIGVNTARHSQNSYSVAIGNQAGDVGQLTQAIAIGNQAGNNSQGNYTIAVGRYAGRINQNTDGIAIGREAGSNNQSNYGVAIGLNAGKEDQNVGGIAIGINAGKTDQQLGSVAIGASSGQTTQGTYSVAIGRWAAKLNQKEYAVAIGQEAGCNLQSDRAIAIGSNAGRNSQGIEAVAIGNAAGCNSQAADSVAIGNKAGRNSQAQYGIAIGRDAGSNSQNSSSVAIGVNTGRDSQAESSVAIGNAAGSNNQGRFSVAIGRLAGYFVQGNDAVAIGNGAGSNSQTANGVAIGYAAGSNNQGSSALALGYSAGNINQGNSAIAIGNQAGYTNQSNNSICINATGSIFNAHQSNALFIKPIRTNTTNNSLYYDISSGEITYGLAGTPTVQHKSRIDYGAASGTSLINGLNDNEYIGNSVAMSDDGTILITGGAEDEAGGDGRARIYTLSYTAGPGGANPHWVQQGPDIIGSPNAKFGECVDVTGDGTRFVIGAGAHSIFSAGSTSDGNLPQPGYFEVYEYNSSNNTYTLVGSTVIPRNVDNNVFGQQVAISKNGSRVVVSSPYHNWGSGAYGGFILYELINSSWTEIGHIKGLQSYTYFGGYRGRALAISDDGSRIVAGIHRYDTTPSDTSTNFHGRVEIWEYNSSTGTTTRGLNFNLLHFVDGTNHLDQLGHSATISGNGKVVAYGTHGWDSSNYSNVGKVDVIYEETSTSSWMIKGNNNYPIRSNTDGVGDGGQIDESSNNNFGRANLDLSEDGNVIAAYAYDDNKVLCFQYVASLDKWEDMDSFDAPSGASKYGFGLALTRDGTKLAIGAPHSTTSNYRGLVNTFDITNLYVPSGTLYYTGNNYQVSVMP